MTKAYTMHPGFHTVGGRRLFLLDVRPVAASSRGTVLYIPPIADEMNRSRAMIAAQARCLASSGLRVVLPDLAGCGDSEGEFQDASWAQWLEDLQQVYASIAAAADGPVSLWGLRLGALLAAQLSERVAAVERLVLWQPVLNGEHQVDQLLKVGVAASIGDANRQTRADYWAAFRRGDSVAVAGYTLTGAVAQALSQQRLRNCRPRAGMVIWRNFMALAEASPAEPPEVAVREAWQAFGLPCRAVSSVSRPFWRQSVAPSSAVRLQLHAEDFADAID